jgi:hypothetical protein
MRTPSTRLLCIAAALAVAGGAAGCSGNSGGSGAGAQASAPANTASGSFGEGTVHIGEQAPPGIYAADVPKDADGCYFEIAKDGSGDTNSILSTNTFGSGAHVLVEVVAGQYLKTVSCGTFTPAVTPATPAATFAAGVFRVGIDIAAGSYAAVVPMDSDGCFAGVAKDGPALFSSVLTTDDFDPGAQAKVSVTAGQWLATDGCGTWAKA